MPTRVKLCAIARDEGPHLAEWVFHHLRFGFEGIEVWVNGSRDGSLRILERIAAHHPTVRGRRADRLLRKCLANGQVFQLSAYQRMAKRAREEGYTHVAFLDLDEYWTPRDFRSGIASFLPEDPDVKVVSFPWCLDVPDPARTPFTPVLPGPVRVQLDLHVKSAMRLDGSIRRWAVHTGATRGGTRLWVREGFPMVDKPRQVGYSLATEEFLAGRWHELPEAFVLHAIHRSPQEYLGSLFKGMRQLGWTDDVKINRFGFLPAATPVLTLHPRRSAQASYRRARRRFMRTVGVDDLTARARSVAAARADALVDRVAAEPELLAKLRLALRGLSLPELDAVYPGWDQRVLWSVEGVQAVQAVRAGEGQPSRTVLRGWAFSTPAVGPLDFGLRDAGGQEWTDLEHTVTERPDVHELVAAAPPRCGFELVVPDHLVADLAGCQFLVRPRGSAHWDVTPLEGVAAVTP